MDQALFDDYVQKRYSDQTGWYSSKASTNKAYYVVFQWAVIILSASLPVLISALPESYQWIAITISILLAIGTAGLRTFKFQENWINYRTISESLKKEKHYFDAELGEYRGETDKQALFVERVENLISRENTLWVMTHTPRDDDEPRRGAT